MEFGRPAGRGSEQFPSNEKGEPGEAGEVCEQGREFERWKLEVGREAKGGGRTSAPRPTL